MDNFILVTDGCSPVAVENRLKEYLPGLDTRLFAFSPHQAIVRASILRSLEIDYPGLPAREMLQLLGVSALKPIDDETSALVLAGRDATDLPSRPAAPAAKAAPTTRLARAAGAPRVGLRLDWHLASARIAQAWELLGGPDAIDWGSTKVGQIDTGYTPHPVFGVAGASWLDTVNARTFFPAASAGDATTAFPSEPGGGLDNGEGISAGHGTRIGSALCGHDHGAAGGPFFGAAPKLPLVPVRITDIVWINHAQREFRQAVDHLLGQDVKVINVSLGVFLGAQIGALRRAVNDCYEAGVIMVCAAGNFVNSVVGPANLARTIAVAGVTREDLPWSGSSFGPQVDFSAPAADLRRATVKGTDRFGYGAGGDGTSYAAALASGAAALWLTHRAAEIAAEYTKPWQVVEGFRDLARRTARVPAVWNAGAFGTGILDVEALLKAPLAPAASLLEAGPA